MTLLELINSQKKNTERYNFIIYFQRGGYYKYIC